MKKRVMWYALAALVLTACGSDPSRTHRGDLLDDKVTTQRVQSELTRAGRDFQNVHVSTTNGVVTLSGSVNSPQARLRAEQLVHNVHRVTDIDDELQVRD